MLTARVSIEVRKGISARESHRGDAYGEESQLVLFHVKGDTEADIFSEITRFVSSQGIDLDLSPGRSLHIIVYNITQDTKKNSA